MREQLILVGTSFRRVGFQRLGAYVLSTEDAAAIADLRDWCGASEIVYVATCNRVEAYLAVPRGAPWTPADLPARVAEFLAARGEGSARAEELFVLEGDAALAHLFSVVASLQSLVLGECEISGQVRRAADFAATNRLCGPFLRGVFQRAARVAKRVRAETAIGRTPVSVASLVLRRMREHFRERAPRRAVLLGVGDVTKKIAGALQGGDWDILFVNRTERRAAELAARYGGRFMSLERFRADPPTGIDFLVSATRAPGVVIDRRAIARATAAPRAERLLIADLGVPPDVDHDVAEDPAVRLLTLADLEVTAAENRVRLAAEVGRVEAIVAEEARRLATEMRLRALAEESMEAILAGRLAHLAPSDRDTLRRFAAHLAERIARQPAPPEEPAPCAA